MTQGVLLFCFDTPEVKYHRVLERCVGLIKKNLKLEITVVTNIETFKRMKPMGMINYKLITNETGNKLLGKPWYQTERYMAYELSPYDTTLLLDIDYFCYTDNLLQLMETDQDFLIHDKAYDIVLGKQGLEFERDSMIPILWATVIVFKKTNYCRNIFELVKYIKQYWPYFCELYKLSFKNFRNDYAFSIAINHVNGYRMPNFLPGKLPTLTRTAEVLGFTDNGLIYRYQNTIGQLENQDVHVLNKELVNV